MTDELIATTINNETSVRIDRETCEKAGNYWRKCGDEMVCVSRHIYEKGEFGWMCKKHRELRARDAARNAIQPRRGPKDMNL